MNDHENEDFEQRWNKLQEQKEAEANERIAQLDKQLPKEEIFKRLAASKALANSGFNNERELYGKLSEFVKGDKASGTETPQGIQKQQLLTDPLTYQEVEQKVFDLLPNSSTALKIVLAVAASGNFKNAVMLWLLLVGVPSSGKTDLVRLIKDTPFTYYLDNLTLNALISGERPTEKEKVHDLLPLLDKKCLIVKDWTSIFSLDEKMTKKILGDLVGVYDKEFTKFSSRRGQISYNSEFSQLGCVTPATLNRHTNYMNMVGPRFLFYTMPGMTDEEEANSFDLIFSGNNRAGIEKEARLFVSSYLNQLLQQTLDIQPLSKEVANYLKIAAKLMACARGIVILQSASFTDEEGKTNTYYEVLDVQIEQPWRAIQQLTELATYLAFVTNKQEVGTEELAIIKEVVISSMPQDRSQALRMIKESNGEVTAKQLSDLSDKSIRTARRLLDELTALNILKKVQGSGNIANGYKITDKFRDFILLDTTEFLSPYSSEPNPSSEAPFLEPSEEKSSSNYGLLPFSEGFEQKHGIRKEEGNVEPDLDLSNLE